MASADIYSRLEHFSVCLLKQNGDIREKGIHKWHLADDITASGIIAASGIFEYLRLDGPTTPGYVWTAIDVDGWGAWLPGAGDHALLTNLNWADAAHTIDADILPVVGSTYDVGGPQFSFAEGHFDNLYGDGTSLTGIPRDFLALSDTPNSYLNWAASGVRVNASETGLEFCALNSGGGGGSTTITGAGYSLAFTDADLVGGILTVNHNLRVKTNVTQVYDENWNAIIPDDITLDDLVTLHVHLGSYIPITGTWHVVVVAGGGPNNFAGGYTHSQVAPLTEWTVQHNLGTEDVVVQVMDSDIPSHVIEPQEIEIVDLNTVHVLFPSGVTGKARVISTNAVGVSVYGTHDQLSNLEWSVAGHTIDTDILPTASGSANLGSAALPFASGYFNDVYVKEESLHIGNNTSISAPSGSMTFKDQEVPSVTLKGLMDSGTSGAVPVATVLPYAGSTAPTGYLLCDGSTVSQAAYTSLFAVIQHTYGADPGGGNFILPNLKGKVPVGYNAAETEFDTLGETGGSKVPALLAHTHTAAVDTPNHSYVSGVLNANGAHNTDTGSTQSGSQTSGNLQPYITLNYIIKT